MAPAAARPASGCCAGCSQGRCSPRSTPSRSTSGWLAPPSFRPAFPSGRYRLISGLALEVLPRLADGAYDLVFCDADRQELTDYLASALRLLRPGGILLMNGVLPGSVATERMPTDAEASAAAELREQVRADDRLVPLLLPIGSGVLAAAKHAG